MSVFPVLSVITQTLIRSKSTLLERPPTSKLFNKLFRFHWLFVHTRSFLARNWVTSSLFRTPVHYSISSQFQTTPKFEQNQFFIQISNSFNHRFSLFFYKVPIIAKYYGKTLTVMFRRFLQLLRDTWSKWRWTSQKSPSSF